MRWNERPRRALVLLKPEQEMLPLAAQTIDFLQQEIGLKVMVEAAAAEDVGQVCVIVCVRVFVCALSVSKLYHIIYGTTTTTRVACVLRVVQLEWFHRVEKITHIG